MKAIRKGLYSLCFFAEYWLGIKVNPFQQRLFEMISSCLWGGEYSKEDLIELLVDAGNRTGKTVALAILHIYFAYYKIGATYGPGYDDFKYRTFDISPHSRQAKECLKYIKDILEGRLTWQVDGRRYSNSASLKLTNFYEGQNENLGELRYTNRSVTYAFSTGEDMGAGFAGLPAGLVTYDECVLSHHLEDELDANVYSRLGDYGKLVALVSTPNEEGHSQQYFYHLISQADNLENNYKVVHGSFMENIFISEEKRESHAKTLMDRDPVMARQILFGEFVTTGGVMFETQVIERIWDRGSLFADPVPEHKYVIAIDWGVADKGDETVMLVFDLDALPFRIARVYSKQGADPYELVATATLMAQEYNDAEVIMDTGSMGGKMFKKMLKQLKTHDFEAAGSKNVKGDALMFTQVMLTKDRKKRIGADGKIYEDNPNFGWIRAPYISKLAAQLSTYRIEDAKLKQDWVSALYIGCHYIWKRFGDQVKSQRSFRFSPFRVARSATELRPFNNQQRQSL